MRASAIARIGGVGLLGLALVLAGTARVFDAELLDAAARCPGFWHWVGNELVLAAGWAVLVGAVWSVRSRVRRQPAFALLAVILLAALQVGLRAGVPAGPPIDFAQAADRHGHDLGAYQVAAGELVGRVVSQVPRRARVALIHDIADVYRLDLVSPRVPLFLFYLTCPRVYYLYEGRVPDCMELSREGIGWVLDLRGTDYRRRYVDARLERVNP